MLLVVYTECAAIWCSVSKVYNRLRPQPLKPTPVEEKLEPLQVGPELDPIQEEGSPRESIDVVDHHNRENERPSKRHYSPSRAHQSPGRASRPYSGSHPRSADNNKLSPARNEKVRIDFKRMVAKDRNIMVSLSVSA